MSGSPAPRRHPAAAPRRRRHQPADRPGARRTPRRDHQHGRRLPAAARHRRSLDAWNHHLPPTTGPKTIAPNRSRWALPPNLVVSGNTRGPRTVAPASGIGEGPWSGWRTREAVPSSPPPTRRPARSGRGPEPLLALAGTAGWQEAGLRPREPSSRTARTAWPATSRHVRIWHVGHRPGGAAADTTLRRRSMSAARRPAAVLATRSLETRGWHRPGGSRDRTGSRQPRRASTKVGHKTAWLEHRSGHEDSGRCGGAAPGDRNAPGGLERRTR